MTDDDFDGLLVAARTGDEDTFGRIWQWLHPSLLRWLAIVARPDHEDVAADVWMSVARGLDTFVGGADDFRGWVFTIARRRAIDQARRAARRPQFARLGDVDPIDRMAGTASCVEADEELSVVRDLLGRLTADQREVVALRVVADMTVGETARIVGKSEVAVRVLCHRGLRALACHLAAREDIASPPDHPITASVAMTGSPPATRSSRRR